MKLQNLYNTILKPKGSNYSNEGKLAGQDFIFNTQIDKSDYTYTNRIGLVESVPAAGAPFEEGDEVLVHHNVFRQFWSSMGSLVDSAEFIGEGLYSANPETIYAYRKPGDEWTMIDGYLLVKPVEDDNGGFKEHHGIIVAGKGKGDYIFMNKNCEYEFWIDDDMFYRVREVDIAAKIL